MATWLNSDGLYIKTGTSKTTGTPGGEYVTTGAKREIEFKIDLSTLATASATILSDVVFFPAGVRIESVEVVSETGATSSGSGTLSVGLVKTDRTTAIDATAFVSAMPKGTVDTAGKQVTLIAGASNAGTSIGATTAFVGYVTAQLATAVYQTGVIALRIRYTAVY